MRSLWLIDRVGPTPVLHSWSYADAYVRAPERHAPVPDVMFYRRPVSPRGYSRIEDPALWLPFSCAFALIGSGVAAGSSDTSNVTTGSYNTSGANFAVASVGYYRVVGAGAMDDSNHNTWNPLTAQPSFASDTVNRLYYTQGGTFGSGHTFSFNGSGNYPSLSVLAFSGAAVSPFDVENGNVATSTTVQPGNVTPSVDNEVVISGLGTGNAGDNPTINLSFSTPLGTAYASGQHFGSFISYLIETTAAGKNPTWTSSVSEGLASTIACFKAAAGGGGSRGLFMTANLSGLGGGGSFFVNPLGRAVN